MTKIINFIPPWAMFLILVVPFVYGNLVPYGAALSMLPFFFWVYSLASESRRCTSQQFKRPIIRLQVGLTVPMIYLLVATYAPVGLPLMTQFNIAATLSLIYSLHFVAKTIRTAELGVNAEFKHWYSTFIGLWLFPIGVWFIQGKIVRMTHQETG